MQFVGDALKFFDLVVGAPIDDDTGAPACESVSNATVPLNAPVRKGAGLTGLGVDDDCRPVPQDFSAEKLICKSFVLFR